MPCPEGHRCTQTYFSDIHALYVHVVAKEQTKALLESVETSKMSSFVGCPSDTTAVGELAKLRLGQADNVKERGKVPLLKSRPLGPDRACRNPQAMREACGNTSWPCVNILLCF